MDIYTRVPVIWFIFCVLLVNEHKTAQPSSCTTTSMNEEPQDEIYYTQRGQFAPQGVALASHTTFTALTSCI
jgi:hypothetical protein